MRLSVLSVLAGLLSVLVGASAAAQSYKAPRTPHGVPDLQGMWATGFLTTFERPPVFKSLTISEDEARTFEAAHTHKPVLAGDIVGQDDSEWWELGLTLARIDGKARTSWIVDPADGRLPYTEAGLKLVQQRQASVLGDFDGPEARPLSERCLVSGGSRMGPPMFNGGHSNDYQIVQTKDHLVIHNELLHTLRIIRLGDRNPTATALKPWHGDSVARWEGETLVVETEGLSAQETLRTPTRMMLSPAAKVVERFRRISPTAMLYSFSVEDPAMFTQVWRGEVLWETTKARIYEFACHEGNYSLEGVLAGARQFEARQAAAP
jgi:hypothetical protein